MYDELGPDGTRVHTVQRIATEFGIERPTVTASSGDVEHPDLLLLLALGLPHAHPL